MSFLTLNSQAMKKLILAASMLLALPAAKADDKTKKETPATVDLEMVSVSGGRFDMGEDSAAMDRRPAHSVVLKDFRIGKYEVTQAQWEAIMGSNPSAYNHCDDCPVTNVSWNDIQTFIEKLNAKTGRHFRLPTEAEWEFAARSGKQEHMRKLADDQIAGNKHSGRHVLQYIAWFDRNSNDHPHRVGRKDPNKLGLFDMTGNVEEWVNDWYGKSYFSAREANNPTGPDGGISKVVRGGGWHSAANEVSVTRRAAYLPTEKSISLGFRLAE